MANGREQEVLQEKGSILRENVCVNEECRCQNAENRKWQPEIQGESSDVSVRLDCELVLVLEPNVLIRFGKKSAD
jgi:hypothetical protein